MTIVLALLAAAGVFLGAFLWALTLPAIGPRVLVCSLISLIALIGVHELQKAGKE